MEENNKMFELEENEIVRISILRIPGSDEFKVLTTVSEDDIFANDIAETILEAIDDTYADAETSNEQN